MIDVKPRDLALIDLQSLELELHNARQARINAELACCDIEELTETIRQAQMAFMAAAQRRVSLH